MQATTIPTNSGSATPSYQPSVPITVYRQLATELQNTKERLASLETEHKLLTNQNQALKLEFSAIASANQQIQNLVLKSATEVQAIGQSTDQRLQTLLTPAIAKAEVIQAKSAPVKSEPPKKELAKTESFKSQVALPFEVRTVSEPAPNNAQAKSDSKPESIKLHTEEPSIPIATETKNTSLDRGLSGWWLSLTVICIVLVSFGAGYLLMKPFANRN